VRRVVEEPAQALRVAAVVVAAALFSYSLKRARPAR